MNNNSFLQWNENEWRNEKCHFLNPVPNQKIIKIQKEKADKNNLYAVINLSALDKAANVLQKTVSMKLWIYFAKNQDKYQFALSMTAFRNWAGCGKSAYDSAVAELIEKGYLQHTSGNYYTFIENPS